MIASEHQHGNVARLAQSRLTWLERNVWFRQAISALSRPAKLPSEVVIELLPTLLRLPHQVDTVRSDSLPAVLTVLTTYQLLIFSPGWSTQVSTFPGDRIIRVAYEAPVVRVFTQNPQDPTAEYFIDLIHDASRYLPAQQFVLAAGLLAAHQCWGNIEKLTKLVKSRAPY